MTDKELKDKIDFIENSPSCSYWLKQAWEGAKKRDPVDALTDAELLAEVCMAKWISLTGSETGEKL